MLENISKITCPITFSDNAKQFTRSLFSGALASSISKTLIAPLETVRLRMQISDELLKHKIINKPYKSVYETYNRIKKEEGYKALYKGNLYNVLLYFPTQSVNFAVKPLIKNYLKKNACEYIKKNNFILNLLTGSLTGMTTAFIFQPFEYAKTQIYADIKKKYYGQKSNYNGLIDVFKKEYKKNGIKKFYRGVGSSLICMFIYRGFYFGLYDTLNNKISKSIIISNIISPSNPLIKLINGFIATDVAGFVAYPFDSIRRKMMIDDTYKSSYSCAKKIISKKGLSKLYKGSGAMILRGLAGASILVLYEQINDLLEFNKKI